MALSLVDAVAAHAAPHPEGPPKAGVSKDGRKRGRENDSSCFRRRMAKEVSYFFFPGPKSGCQAASLRFGAAAITLAFSFFGFLVSRLPFCCPLAMTSVSSVGVRVFECDS